MTGFLGFDRSSCEKGFYVIIRSANSQVGIGQLERSVPWLRLLGAHKNVFVIFKVGHYETVWHTYTSITVHILVRVRFLLLVDHECLYEEILSLDVVVKHWQGWHTTNLLLDKAVKLAIFIDINKSHKFCSSGCVFRYLIIVGILIYRSECSRLLLLQVCFWAWARKS